MISWTISMVMQNLLFQFLTVSISINSLQAASATKEPRPDKYLNKKSRPTAIFLPWDSFFILQYQHPYFFIDVEPALDRCTP